MRRVRDALKLDYELQKGYVYLEQRRDLRISKLGKVTIGPLRTFEVYPSTEPGQTYKRLIAVDGRRLDAAELARRDEEHRRDLLSARKSDTNPPEEMMDARRQRDALLDDALAVFDGTIVGHDDLDGTPVIVVALSPRQGAVVKTREGKWMKHFDGRMWVSEADYQIGRIELRAIDDVSIGWGIVGRIHDGSRFAFSRHKVGGVWLPAEATFDASGKTLLFRSFQIRLVTTYSEYRKAPSGF